MSLQLNGLLQFAVLSSQSCIAANTAKSGLINHSELCKLREPIGMRVDYIFLSRSCHVFSQTYSTTRFCPEFDRSLITLCLEDEFS